MKDWSPNVQPMLDTANELEHPAFWRWVLRLRMLKAPCRLWATLRLRPEQRAAAYARRPLPPPPKLQRIGFIQAAREDRRDPARPRTRGPS